jgi:drug/metabolite transporter (DMT)-like permease
VTDLTASPPPQRPRRRRPPWIAAGLAVLVVAGLAPAYFAFVGGSSAKRLALMPSAGPAWTPAASLRRRSRSRREQVSPGVRA